MTSPLSAAALFTPLPSGVGPYGQPQSAVANGTTWLGIMLTLATSLGLPTTAWQSGGPELLIYCTEAVTFAQADVQISIMAQGGFGQSAASGTVTFVTLQGATVTAPVTPDPSNSSQNPSGSLGWLDVWGQNNYQTTRLSAAAATGPLAIVNLGAGTPGPYTAGTYHVASASGATYSNPTSVTIPPSAIAGTGGQVAGVVPGAQYTILTTTSAHGLSPGQSVYLQIPQSTGITIFPQGNPVPGSGFAIVTAVTSTTFQVSVPSSGVWTAGGTVYLCTVATMAADVAGIASSAGPGTVTTTVTQNANLFCTNLIGWSGTNWESNQAYLARTLLSLAAQSPNGPSQAYVYFAETAGQLLAAQTPAYVLTNGPVQASETANPQTGIVTTVVASATPASTTLGANVTPGCAQNAISAITNANPCVVTCAGAHGLTSGMTVSLSFPPGSAPAALVSALSASFVVTVTGANSFSVPVNTTALGSWVSGGSVEGGDLGAIDTLLQTNVVPDGIVGAVTASALALPIGVTATVIVPQAYVQAYSLAVGVQFAAQQSSYAIGGNPGSPGVAYDDIVGALEEAGVLAVGQASYVRAVQALSVTDGPTTITQAGQAIAFPSTRYQALFLPPSITVIGA